MCYDDKGLRGNSSVESSMGRQKMGGKDCGVVFTGHFFAVFCLHQGGAFNLDFCVFLEVQYHGSVVAIA